MTFSIAPALPAGLTLNRSTGIISGTPTAVTALSPYNVTVTNSQGVSASFPVNIRTADGYLVNDLTDANNVGPSCVSTTGKCTLRAAIQQVNGTPIPNVIVLSPGQVNLTLLAEIPVSASADIYGDCSAGTIVDAQAHNRVFSVSAANFNLSQMTLQNGKPPDATTGGALAANGAVNVTMDHMTITGNATTHFGGGNGEGGGVDIEGGASLTLTNSVISNNTVTGDWGGGVFVGGAGSSIHVSDTVFSGNGGSSNIGGGLFLGNGASAVLLRVLFENNFADSGGGALGIQDPSVATVTNVTFFGNTSTTAGGAVASNSSVVSNFSNCTFVNNSTPNANGAALDTVSHGGGLVTLQNTILANNKAAGLANNCNSAITSTGHNLSDTSTGDCAALIQPGDLVSTTPLLGPLQDNGGPTLTVGLLPGSPGIDQANPAQCAATDQRGFPRLIDAQCDIGAYETQP